MADLPKGWKIVQHQWGWVCLQDGVTEHVATSEEDAVTWIQENVD